MPGRLDQAASRHSGVAKRRMAQLAERVANGMPITKAGAVIGLTKAETASVWASIKAGLGAQAC